MILDLKAVDVSDLEGMDGWDEYYESATGDQTAAEELEKEQTQAEEDQKESVVQGGSRGKGGFQL